MSGGSGHERLKDVRRWLRYAREDLRAAEAAIRDPEQVPRIACFLAQQSAEKALKTVLVALRIRFPRQHDLDALRLLIPEDWAVAREPLELARLTVWAIEARYPGDLPDAAEDDAKEAVGIARAVYDLVSDDLEVRLREEEEEIAEGEDEGDQPTRTEPR
jgi:HEPN domain-containing protein